MSKTLEQCEQELESLLISVQGFVGIGIIDDGSRELIEISVADQSSAIRIQALLKDSYEAYPISVVVTGTIRPH